MKVKWESEGSEYNERENKKHILIEDGVYDFEIVRVEEKYPKNPDSEAGKMLVLLFRVVSGEFHNCTVWKYLCLNHSKPKVAGMAKADLKAIYDAVGLSLEEDTAKLERCKLRGEVFTQDGTGDYPDSNTIKNYKKKIEETPSFDDEDSDLIPF